MKDYELVIIGFNPNLESLNSKHFMCNNIYAEFKKINKNVRVIDMYSDNVNPEELGKCDFMLFINYYDEWLKFDLKKIKEITGFKKIITLSESHYINADWCFVFKYIIANNITLINAPCAKSLYQNKEKIHNSIIIDHAWLAFEDRELDWTYRISDWVKELKEEYTIYRMIRYAEEKYYEHEVIIPLLPFTQYLERTNCAENFIVTHKECYTYGVIDMLARGIRVIIPEGFMSEDVIKNFQLPTFKNKQELLEIIKSPVDKEALKRQYDSMTDYPDIVKMIDEKFRSWIN